MSWLVFLLGLGSALVLRGPRAIVAIVALFVVFVPVEKLFPLWRRRVFRPALLTDLTHLLVNNALVAVGTVALVLLGALPFGWIRAFDLVGRIPAVVSIPLAVVLVSVGNYWGHRLTHQIPILWRFHSVHHSIQHMDFAAAGRLHPFDSAFTQAFTVMPLFLLGYDGGVFAGVGAFVVLLAIFQHANVRLRFPGLRWVVNTPEWHHWHHAIDADARNRNFGLPVVDRLFGTAYLPRDRRPSAFGTDAPVPPTGYVSQLAYPFTRAELPIALAATAPPVRSGHASPEEWSEALPV